MEHSPSGEVDRFSVSKEIPRILWKPKIHYRIHNSLPPVPILSQINLVHTSTSHLKILFNIIFPSMPGCYRWSPPRRFPHKNPAYTSPLPHSATCPAHL